MIPQKYKQIINQILLKINQIINQITKQIAIHNLILQKYLQIIHHKAILIKAAIHQLINQKHQHLSHPPTIMPMLHQIIPQMAIHQLQQLIQMQIMQINHLCNKMIILIRLKIYQF
eukprot:NODE_1101_length_2211_cov_0.531723.p2 type:complete len:116 gc:universal NODE_1101_length_2211_cov_0.531723:1534-1187(-)